MYFKTEDNLNLYYEFRGNPDSKNYLLFLNGIFQSTESWNDLIPAFENKYKIILCDFIFQGQSDKNGDVRSFKQHAADINRLLAFLNIQKISLIGISYGSIVAQHFALDYPKKVNSLVLLSTFARKSSYFESMLHVWYQAMDIYPEIKHIFPIKKLVFALKIHNDFRKELKSLKILALIIHGEKDMLVPMHFGKEVAESIHGSRFVIIPGAGHILTQEPANATARIINQYLQIKNKKGKS